MQLFCWMLMPNYQQMEINQVMLKSWQKKAIEVLQQFTLFCDEGEDLREVLSKVNTYSQRATAKRKKQKAIKDYFKP